MSERGEIQQRMKAIETMPNRWLHGCADKKPHPSKDHALAIRRDMLAESEAAVLELENALIAAKSYAEAEPLWIAWERAISDRIDIGRYLMAYKCPCCHKWHMGNDQPWRKSSDANRI